MFRIALIMILFVGEFWEHEVEEIYELYLAPI